MQAAHASQYSATNTTQKNKDDLQITKRHRKVAQHH